MDKSDVKTQVSMSVSFTKVKFSSILRTITQPEFKCKGGFLIENICTNKLCKKLAFICSNKNCNCYKEHIFCHRYLFNCVTTLIKDRQTFQSNFFDKIYETDNKMIQTIQKSNEAMANQISLGSFEEKYMKILEKVYIDKKWDSFYGVQMDQLYIKLIEQNKEDKVAESELQNMYQKKMNYLVQQGIRFKKEIFSAFLTRGKIQEQPLKPWIDSPLVRMFLATTYANTLQCYKNKQKFQYSYLEHLDADRKAFDKEYLLFLQQQLYNAKSAELILTASQNQFKSAQFHKKCDNVQNTLTVIRTEFGKTIFAFAAQKWTSSNAHTNDTSGRSCIILLDLKKKCPIVNAGHSIYCHQSLGPTFGAYDIYISNDCHTNNSSYCNFPVSYNNGYSAGQTSYTTICGQPNGYNFKVIEYQVFRIVY